MKCLQNKFETIKLGTVPSQQNDPQAPHVNLIVMMRGMLVHAYSRLYFSDEPEANTKDPVLSSLPKARHATLMAQREEAPSGLFYCFNIQMQGTEETVFFDA